MLRKPLQLICCILFSIIIQTACTKPTDTLVTPMPTLVQPLVQVTQDKITGMVNIGERSLYINCEGEGIPTIVLVYGRDSSIDVWNLNTFYNDLKKITRTCEYDRANVGKSDPGPTPITTQDSANDLHSLLINAHVPGPYILVAHSLGGWIVRLYAGQYPEEVDGMVLLDGLHPDVGLRISAALPRKHPMNLRI
jgi:pimeloyl-ACP methyl ester carboxylesterase